MGELCPRIFDAMSYSIENPLSLCGMSLFRELLSPYDFGRPLSHVSPEWHKLVRYNSAEIHV
ncbi:hypothetical protein RRF57_005162 [Xylaria bambusicola]|uniref:Uncharacterized protein n=1 Tax=Xylaria bambusicola TaxID=326684 RepID=A0AAN7Z4I4_9PEZI